MSQLQNQIQSPIRELLRLAAPAIAQMASYTLLQFLDTLMLSRVSDIDATASGTGGSIAFSFISFGLGMMLVVNTLVSQSFGRGDFSACGRYVWQGFWVSGAIAILVMPAVVLARPIFHALGHQPVQPR